MPLMQGVWTSEKGDIAMRINEISCEIIVNHALFFLAQSWSNRGIWREQMVMMIDAMTWTKLKEKKLNPQEKNIFPQVRTLPSSKKVGPLNYWELNSQEFIALSQIGCFHQLIGLRLMDTRWICIMVGQHPLTYHPTWQYPHHMWTNFSDHFWIMAILSTVTLCKLLQIHLYPFGTAHVLLFHIIS